jgi:hypothetical protein
VIEGLEDEQLAPSTGLKKLAPTAKTADRPHSFIATNQKQALRVTPMDVQASGQLALPDARNLAKTKLLQKPEAASARRDLQQFLAQLCAPFWRCSLLRCPSPQRGG